MKQRSSLAQRLKELRKLNHLSQEDVASALGVVRQTYSHYENGRRTPKYDVLFKISSLYGISLDDLMALVDASSSDESLTETNISSVSTNTDNELSDFLDYFSQPRNENRFKFFSAEEKELIYYFQKLPKSEKKELIDIAKLKYKKLS